MNGPWSRSYLSNPYRRFCCAWCGGNFNTGKDGRTHYAERNPDGRGVLCEDCFSEHYEDRCVLCEEPMRKQDRGFVFIPKVEDEEQQVPEGFYRVLDFPLYVGWMLGPGRMQDDNMAFMGPPGPAHKAEEGGHCCHSCVQKAGLFGPLKLPVFNADGTMKHPAMTWSERAQFRAANQMIRDEEAEARKVA